MEQLAGDLLNDSDSDDQDYVPPAGELEEVAEEVNSEPDDDSDEDEQQKKRTDALWADFMADVEPTAKKVKLDTEPNARSKASDPQQAETGTDAKLRSSQAGEKAAASSDTVDKQENNNEDEADNANDNGSDLNAKAGASSSGKMRITQVFDFAGEKIEVEKVVEVGSKEAKKLLTEQDKQKEASEKQTVLVRPKVGGGLGVVVGSILNKKNKMSVLEKSKLDWNGFKRQEGIEEELATFNRGKGGYLEKMAFLERADLRQFDIEKAMREKRRKH